MNNQGSKLRRLDDSEADSDDVNAAMEDYR